MATSRGISVGIIGAGGIAGFHYNGYRRAGADVVALADVAEETLEARADAWGIERRYLDYHDLLADPDIDAVSICVPNSLHPAVSIAALEAGKHVLCEKPIALDLEQAEAMIAAAEQTGLVFMINHQLRSDGAARKAKVMLASGQLGELAFVRLRQAHDWGGTDPRASFTTRASAGGGTLLDNGCHLFDLARFFAGDVTSLFALTATRKFAIELEDTALVSLQFASGAIGSVEVSWSATGWEEAFWIYGSEGALEYTNRLGKPVLRHTFRDSPWTTWDDTDVTLYDYAEASSSAHSRHIGAFLSAIRGDQPVACSGRDGLEAVRLVLASYRSAAERIPVEVATVGGSLRS